MNNKKYLLGLIFYGVFFAISVWIDSLNLLSSIDKITIFFQGTLMLIPTLLVWFVFYNARDRNYKFLGAWSVILLISILLVVGIWLINLPAIGDIIDPDLIEGFILVPFLFPAIVVLYFLLKKKFKVALYWALPYFLLLLGIGIWVLFFAPSRPAGPAPNARIISKMGQLRTKAALVASEEESYASLDCNYDSELQDLCEDIDQNNPKDFGGPQIYTSKESYCAYTPLNRKSADKENQWYCIDSTGVAEQTVVNPSQSEYCSGGNFVCPPRNKN